MKIFGTENTPTIGSLNLRVVTDYTLQYKTMENLHSKTDKHTVSLI